MSFSWMLSFDWIIVFQGIVASCNLVATAWTLYRACQAVRILRDQEKRHHASKSAKTKA